MKRPSTRRRSIQATAGILVLAGLLFVSASTAAGDDAEITVNFAADDQGFTATSSKAISNIQIEFCEPPIKKHDNLTAHTYTYSESMVIVGVWVKSGNNHVDGQPSGSGERFENTSVDCDPAIPCEITNTCPDPCIATNTCPDPCVATNTCPDPCIATNTCPDPCIATNTCPTDSETSSTTSSGTTSTRIPFFPSTTAIALGLGGIVAAGLVMLRRRV